MGDSFEKTLSGGKFDEFFSEVTHSETLGLKNPEQLRLKMYPRKWTRQN